MKNALIGYSGFVGSYLTKINIFDDFFNSANIQEIQNNNYEFIICAGASAEKWKANLFPKKDRENIYKLIDNLQKIKAKYFILISTVDVFSNPINVDEDSNIDLINNNAYGKNRRILEQFVIENFEKKLIVRLPGLVGEGLKKNALYDIKNNNQIQNIDSRNIYQFYPMQMLWEDIKKSMQLQTELIHLTSEPISISEAFKIKFNKIYKNHILDKPIKYNFKSKFASEFNSKENYQYEKNFVMKSIQEYFRS